jgi:hypothetical protein
MSQDAKQAHLRSVTCGHVNSPFLGRETKQEVFFVVHAETLTINSICWQTFNDRTWYYDDKSQN